MSSMRVILGVLLCVAIFVSKKALNVTLQLEAETTHKPALAINRRVRSAKVTTNNHRARDWPSRRVAQVEYKNLQRGDESLKEHQSKSRPKRDIKSIFKNNCTLPKEGQMAVEQKVQLDSLFESTSLIAHPRTLFREIGKATGQGLSSFKVANFGANDGKTHDPLYEIFTMDKASGIVVEYDENHRDAINTNLPASNIRKYIGHPGVTRNNIIQLLSENNFTEDNFAIFKMDIDSADYHCTRAAIVEGGFRPMLIIAEIVPMIPPPVQYIPPPDANFGHPWHATSITGYTMMLKEWYVPFQLDHLDLYLIRKDLVGLLGDCPTDDETLWMRGFYERTFTGKALHPGAPKAGTPVFGHGNSKDEDIVKMQAVRDAMKRPPGERLEVVKSGLGPHSPPENTEFK